MATFSFTLPDVCLSIVFDKLPIEDLLHVNLVCRQWYDNYRSACARRRKVALLIGDRHDDVHVFGYVANVSAFEPHPFGDWTERNSPIRHSWIERLQSGALKDRLVSGLVANFDNITSLELNLIHISTESLCGVVSLLGFLAHKLVSLKLWCKLKFSDSLVDLEEFYLGVNMPEQAKIESLKLESSQRALIDLINSMPKLTRLSIDDYEESIFMMDATNQPILPLQNETLEEFHYGSYEISRATYNAIFAYVQSSPNLGSISLGQRVSTVEQFEHLVSCDPQVASRITQLYLHSFVSESQLGQLCGHFTNLTTLRLTQPKSSLSYGQLTACLSHCARLDHFVLDRIKMHPQAQQQHDHNPHQFTIQLPSIRKLSLTFDYVGSHRELDNFKLALTFPNLEKISLNVHLFVCSICADFGWDFDSSGMEWTDCRVHFLAPLKKHQQLRLIKYQDAQTQIRLYSKEDLL